MDELKKEEDNLDTVMNIKKLSNDSPKNEDDGFL